jgi:hypothetical protein
MVERGRRRQGSAYFPFSLPPCSLISLSPLPTPHPPFPNSHFLLPSDLDPLLRLVAVFDRVDDQVVENFGYARGPLELLVAYAGDESRRRSPATAA